jgi:hypothetical protein
MLARRRWLNLVACVGLCSTIPAAWATAEAPQPEPQSAIDLSGTWEGTWTSCTSGHHGPMKATFCRIDATHYRVEFRGKFFVILPFKYTVTLEVVGSSGDSVELAGSSYLGKMYGCFHYTATADACHFNAKYTSCKDCGRFDLCRKTICTSCPSSCCQ